MSDLIDRQALLRQIDIDSDGEPGYYGDTWKFIDTIKRMPSALGTNLAEVGTDAISRQQAIEIVEKYFEKIGLNGDICVDGLRQLPPIQPEIVHCKDCRKHNKKLGFGENYNITYKDDACPLIPWRGMSKGHEHDYQSCSFAERREVTT